MGVMTTLLSVGNELAGAVKLNLNSK